MLHPAAVVWHFDDAPFVIVLAAALTFESLADQTKQHFTAEVTEGGCFVRVHGECVGSHQWNVFCSGGVNGVGCKYDFH